MEIKEAMEILEKDIHTEVPKAGKRQRQRKKHRRSIARH